MSTSPFLHAHGTRAFTLKPGSIVQAAVSDLKLRGKKEPVALQLPDPELQAQQYAFARKHVRKAANAAELIRLAIDEPEEGTASGKLNTRIIYGDPELLKLALASVMVA